MYRSEMDDTIISSSLKKGKPYIVYHINSSTYSNSRLHSDKLVFILNTSFLIQKLMKNEFFIKNFLLCYAISLYFFGPVIIDKILEVRNNRKKMYIPMRQLLFLARTTI